MLVTEDWRGFAARFDVLTTDDADDDDDDDRVYDSIYDRYGGGEEKRREEENRTDRAQTKSDRWRTAGARKLWHVSVRGLCGVGSVVSTPVFMHNVYLLVFPCHHA